jgi:hypothetical protein
MIDLEEMSIEQLEYLITAAKHQKDKVEKGLWRDVVRAVKAYCPHGGITVYIGESKAIITVGNIDEALKFPGCIDVDPETTREEITL